VVATGRKAEEDQMPRMTHAERGAIGGRLVAERMTAEERQARSRAGAQVGAVNVIERSWTEMPEQLRERVRAVVASETEQ
jgi:hypothetical protein